MRAELKRLQGDLGTTTIYVTHDQIEAMTLAHRVAVMNKGVVQQIATPREIYDDPANLFVAGFIGSPPMNTLPQGALADGGFVCPAGRFATGLAAPQRRDRRLPPGGLPDHRPAGGRLTRGSMRWS